MRAVKDESASDGELRQLLDALERAVRDLMTRLEQSVEAFEASREAGRATVSGAPCEPLEAAERDPHEL